MNILKYLLISTSCLSLFYLAYLTFSKNENNFRFLRFFLLFIIAFSLALPFSNFTINISSFFQQTGFNFPDTFDISKVSATQLANSELKKDFNWFEVLKNLYLIISTFFIIRLLWQFGIILKTYLNFEKEKRSGYKLVLTQNINHSFSFFKWIFIPKCLSLEQNKIDKILAHEKIHVSQYHSIDIILIELLSAVMWFNPLVWMMRNSIQLVHEYLADEGVLNAGIDKVKYQSLLLNLIAEERLIRLPSGFNHSLIKKRIIMMTKSKTYTKTKAKLIALLSLAAALFIIVSCMNGIEETTGSETIEIAKGFEKEKPVYYVDGEKVENIDNLDPNSIISVNVVKKENTIYIETKKNTTEDEIESLKIKSNNSSNLDIESSLILVDGEEVENIEDLDINSVKSVTALKKDNTINIETKKKATENETESFNIRNSNSSNPDIENVLILVDGKVITKKDFKKIDPNTINSISVIKNKESLKKFTTDSKYESAIIIELKK